VAKRRVDRATVILARAATHPAASIADLDTPRNGASRPTDATQTSLEVLARERPTKVAELLRSTWLADRER